MTKIKDIVDTQNFQVLIKQIERQKGHIEKLSNFRELIIETIKASVLCLPHFDPPKIKIGKPIKKYPPETAVLDFSDAQIGSLVSKISTGGLCNYNVDTFLKRIDRMTKSAIEITHIQRRGGIPLKKLSIHVLGDIVQGENVFPGQGYYIEVPLIEQVFRFGRQCVDKIFYPLAQIFDEIEIYCIAGNHGKQGRPGEAHRSTNWDYIVYIFWQEIMKKDCVDLLTCPDCDNGIRTTYVRWDKDGELDYIHGKRTGVKIKRKCRRCNGTGKLDGKTTW